MHGCFFGLEEFHLARQREVLGVAAIIRVTEIMRAIDLHDEFGQAVQLTSRNCEMDSTVGFQRNEKG